MITFRKDDKIEYPLSDTILPIKKKYHNGGITLYIINV